MIKSSESYKKGNLLYLKNYIIRNCILRSLYGNTDTGDYEMSTDATHTRKLA